MKIFLLISISCLGLLTGCKIKSASVTTDLAPQQPTKSFLQLCQQKDSLATPTKLTIDVLLNEAGTNDCQQANVKLERMTELDLYKNKISDLSPLSGFTNLNILDLSINEVSDVSPLSKLVKLQYLSLSNNKVSDVSPLSKLTNLTFLGLNNNKVKTIKSLSTLAGMTDITVLDNEGIDRVCPLEAHVCNF